MKKIRFTLITLGLALLLISAAQTPAAAAGANTKQQTARACFEILGFEICY